MSDVVNSLAALEYYEMSKGGKSKKSFEDLDDEQRKPFIEGAGRVLNQINKLNLMLVKKVSPEQEEAARTTRQTRCLTRAQAVVAATKVFRREVFPLKELVLQVLEEADHAS